MHARTHARLHARAHARTHARTHAPTHARTYARTQDTPVTAMAIDGPPKMFPFRFSAGVLNGRMAFNSTPSLLHSSLSKF